MILFKKDGRYPEYVYGGVSREMARDFMTARSVGTFYHQNIKDRSGFRVRRAFGSYRLGAIGRRIRNVFRRR